MDLDLYKDDQNFCKDFPNNFFANATHAVNAQRANDIPDNCKVELPKIIGFSCKQRGGTKRAKSPKKEKTSKKEKTNKTKKAKTGTRGDGTHVQINVIYFCDSCTRGTLNIPRQPRRGDRLNLSRDSMNITIGGISFMHHFRERGFFGYYCDCERIAEGTTQATCGKCIPIHVYINCVLDNVIIFVSYV